MRRIIGLFLVVFMSLFVHGFANEQALKYSKKLKNERIYLHFGEYGVNDFYEYSGSDGDAHPVGADFSNIYWNPLKLGKITVGTPYAELAIDNVFKVMGTNFKRFKGDGIQKITVYSSLHLEEFTNSYHAYHAYIEITQQINQKGWKQYFSLDMERIDKADNLKHMKEKSGKVIDPTYILTFDEWQMIMDSTKRMILKLYNNDLLLTIVINRRFNDPETRKEQYMADYIFVTQRYDQLNLIKNSALMSTEELEVAYKEEKERYQRGRANSRGRLSN